MRFVIKFVVVNAVLFCALWALGSFAMSNAITQWTQDRKVEGWQAKVVTSQGGFPLNVATKIGAVELENPATGDTFSTQGGTVRARTYWPGTVDVALPVAPMVFGSAAGQTSLQMQDGHAQMRLRPGLSLEARKLRLDAGPWVFGQVEGDLLRGQAITLQAVQSARGSARYDVDMTLDGFALGANLRQMLSLPQALPEQFEVVTAKGAVVFDTPVYARHMSQTPPQFRQIILDGAQIDWGGLALRAMGAVDVDARGVPEGAIDLQAKDWRKLLDVAQSAGLLPAERRGQAELMFSLLAARGGSRDDLDLTLEFEAGRMFLSDLPIGLAPNLTIQPQRQ